MNIVQLEDREIYVFTEVDGNGDSLNGFFCDLLFCGTVYYVIKDKQNHYDFWMGDWLVGSHCQFIDSKQGSFTLLDLQNIIVSNLYEHYALFYDADIIDLYKEKLGNNIGLRLERQTTLHTYMIDNQYILEWWLGTNGDLECGDGGFFFYDKDNMLCRLYACVPDLYIDDDFDILDTIYSFINENSIMERLNNDMTFKKAFETICNYFIEQYLQYFYDEDDSGENS